MLGALPYRPTGAQTRALADIAADMAAPTRMNRLLQGDVGSGKTVVALLSMRLRDKEIAEVLNISPKTVNSHLKRIYQKLRVNGRRDAVAAARDLGILRDRRATCRPAPGASL